MKPWDTQFFLGEHFCNEEGYDEEELVDGIWGNMLT